MLLRGRLWATGCGTSCCVMPAGKHQIPTDPKSFQCAVATWLHANIALRITHIRG